MSCADNLCRGVGAVGDHQYQRIAHRIVVERRQELRREQRAKAPRDEQCKPAFWVQEVFRSQYPAAAGNTVWQRVASGAPSNVSAAARHTA